MCLSGETGIGVAQLSLAVGGGGCPSLPPSSGINIKLFHLIILTGRQGHLPKCWRVFPCQELPEMATERFNSPLTTPSPQGH